MKIRVNKSLAWLIIICMIGTLFPSTAFASYSDVEQHWGRASIEKWSDMGVIQGSDGEFRPNDSITRGEMAVIIDRIMKYQTKSNKKFSDLGQAFYTDAILKANAAGVIQGDGTTVRPTDKITREEAVVMLGRAMGLSKSSNGDKTFYDSSKISSWAAEYVNAMANAGYINGSNGSFYPKSNITRAEVITILDNSIKKLFNEEKEYTGDVLGMSIINTPGMVLKNMQIKGDLIISEGVGSGDVTLDSVTVSGKIIIRGGGANSIHISGNSKISEIIIQKTDNGAIRVVTSDGAVVDAVIIDDGNDDIILTGSFNNVDIAAGVAVRAVNAAIKNIEITSADADLDVDDNSKVTEIKVSEDAIGGNITVFGKVDILTADAKITINNQGIITKATIIEGVTLKGNKPVTVITPTTPITTPTKGNSGSHGSGGGSITAKDFNSYTTNLNIDYSQATQLPLTGYFSKTVEAGRSVKVYIPDDAPIRAKFTVIAIPDGVNTYSFLKAQGWINRADENGECLFALEPGGNGWGNQTEENDYITNAMKFLTSGTNDNKISVFSTYGAFYLVGYNTGCAPLESWSANNPIFVNSQVFINGTSVGQEYLDAVGAKKYNGKNTGGYDPGQDDDEFTQTLKDLGYDGTFMSQSEVPVPTWFIGYDNDSYSITYWKKANDVVNTPIGDVYYQDINSDAWQTQYANESILRNNPSSKYGMSQVKVSESANSSAEDIFKFHSNYIRYTTTFAYSNHLEYRLDYGKMLVDLQKKAASATVTSEVYNMPGGKTGSYDFYAQDDIKVTAYDNKTGTVISGIVALTDYNNDGKKDPRDYIVYVPDSAKEIWGDQGAPIVLVHPGMTQTASVFMDASMWWQVANDEGCVIAIVGEAYSSATGVSYKSDSEDFAYMMGSIIGNKISSYVNLDLTRIYGSGHSLGCRTIQDLSMSNPDLMAAVSSTSFPPSTTVRTGEMMPNYFIHGQSDLPFELPDLWGNSGLQDWANYFFEANGLKTDIYSYDSSDTSGRFHTYVWNNSQGIPLVKYGYTLAREHNCMPQEFTMGWDFLEHYSFEKDDDGHVTARYYSPSGFIEDDKIVIEETEDESVKLTAITDMRLLGQKLAAVAIEYKNIVDPDKISVSSYEIKDLDSTGESMATAEISRVYTNNAPEIREDATSVPGKYVIVEIADSSKVGIMMTNYVYYDETETKKTQTYWLKKDVNTTLKQLTDILGIDGEVLSKANIEEMPMTEKTVQLKYDEFNDLLTIPSSSGIDNIMVKYRLPKGYNPSKKYPIMMSLTGQGTSFWQVNGEDNFGTSIAIDKSATAWMDEEDMIIVSTHYRSTVPSSMRDTYSASDDIIKTYEYFIQNYSVDTEKVYLTGNSMGTAMSFQVLMKRPDLVTAFICANGAVNPGGSEYPDTRKDELKVELAEVAKSGVAIWFHHGVSDRSINIQRAQTAYQALLELHEENGRSEEWIKDNLKFTTYKDADFVVDGIDIGPPIYHSATKLAYQISYDSSWEDSLPNGQRGIGISEWVRSKIKMQIHELVGSIETATPTADGTGTGDTNIGKYAVLGTTGTSPNFAAVITGTAILADIESANGEQGEAKWVGVLITTDKKVISLSVKTPDMIEFTELTQADVDEAITAGATGDNTFVWWLKADELVNSKDILIKVTGEDDSTAVTLSVSYYPFEE